MKSIVDQSALEHASKLMATKKSFVQQRRYQLIIITLLLLSGCAKHYTPEAYSDPYGFFSGIWHGFIFPFSLIANIISWCLNLLSIQFLADIQIIGRPNTGFFFYYIGFLLGLSAYAGGA
jgi:hypothetical protein